MIPELGHFALILALGLALVQTVVPFLGAQRNRATWMAVAPNAAYGQLVFQLLAMKVDFVKVMYLIIYRKVGLFSLYNHKQNKT